MSGHNAVFNLGEQQQGTAFEGKFLLAQAGAPSDSTDTGFGKGALYIRTDGSSTSTHWYINLGTAGSPTWTPLTIA